MSQLPDKRVTRIEDVAIGISPEERTAEFDRETLEDGKPHVTNDSTVRDTAGGNKTEILANDYEKALPDHYRLVKMIGRGGMAEVFLAEDKRLGRSVAIKFLNSEFRRDPDRMRRFNREARAASALNHPNILTIHDIGENEGVQFIVSEFVDGDTLGSRIAKGRMPLREAVRVSIQIVSALAASHNAGIVHRDIKPDNVMIRRDGSVKILDFGLAKESGVSLYDATSGEARTLEDAATSPGLILGTPQYMSPEQARGKQLDARTDIFSFGVILFEMVTGNQPFPGGSMVDIIAALIGKEPRSLHEFLDDPPESLVRIVEKALRKNKDERYESTEDLLHDLRELDIELAAVPHTARTTNEADLRTTRPHTIRTILGSSPAKRSALLLVLLVIPVAAILAWWISTRSGQGVTLSTPGAMRMVPITNWSGGTGELVAAASFSPDAKMIAFAATKTGSTEIWAKPVAGGDPIQVTKNGFYNQYPIWAPNGQDIAFFSRRATDRGVWRASFSGGEQVQITSSIGGTARPILWSKSGKIYFQEGNELFSADEKTGEKIRVTDLESTGIKPRTIQISDDEKLIAFSVKEEGSWKVKIADLNGASVSEIGSSAEQIDLLAWEPNGKDVVYSGSANGAYQVFRSAVGEREPKLLSNGNLDFFVQDVSSDGSSVLYGSVTETSDLWKVDISNANQVAIANDVSTEFWPEVSPDGKSVAYQAVNQADRPFRGSVKVVSLSNPAAPLTISAEGFAPEWSHDGRFVAFFRRSDAGISIWRVQEDGGNAIRLADGAVSPPGYLATPYLKIGTGHLSWSPDGGTLAYAARTEGISNIWLVSADGSKRSMVTANVDPSESFCCSAWSPDGMSLVVASEYIQSAPQPKRSFRLWQVNIANNEQKLLIDSETQFRFIGLSGREALIAERVEAGENTPVAKLIRIVALSLNSGVRRVVATINNSYFHNVHLSRDAHTIAYVGRVDDLCSVWTVAVGGGQPKKLIEENDPKILISSLAWSPDGRSIVLGRQTRTNLLSMLSK